MIDFDEALGDVSKAFREPCDIVKNKDLSHEQQVKLLKQWETDLRQLLVASDENMASQKPGEAAEQLQEVRRCLGQLRVRDDVEHSAPNKAGGAAA